MLTEVIITTHLKIARLKQKPHPSEYNKLKDTME